jgi:predicted CoA-binding protein
MELEQILRETKTIAVVGASANPSRPSYGVYRYLRTHTDYQLYPVNPMITAAGGDLAGDTVYPSLADLPVVPDMVDVFRRYEDLPSVLTEVLALPTLPKTLWLQQGLFHEQVGRDAKAAGLQVVMDRCLKVDYANIIG